MDNTAELIGDRPSAAAGSAIPDCKELAATAFERTRMPMVVTDARQPDYPIVLANKAFLDLTGYTAAEVIGRNCRFLQGKGTSAAAVAEIRAALKHERDVTVELLNYRKDGTAFWNQLHFSPVHDEKGQLLYHFGSQQDQTSYRRIEALEASEHRLLMEVDHRAKNVLALVDSIVRLSRSDDADQYAAAIRHRIQALARAHALLAEHGWKDVTLEQVIRAQLDPMGMDRVRVEGPPRAVDAVLVQPLSLVFHELAINAIEHGAFSRSEGAIHVVWREIGCAFELWWTETSGLPALGPGKNGFGLVISDAIIRQQLLGDVERQWLPSGLVTIIRFAQ